MKWLELRVPPPLVTALIALAMWGTAGWGPAVQLPQAAKAALIALLVAGGLAVDLLALLAFRRARTSVNPLRPEAASKLVTGGIFRFTRNPMYLGMAMFLLAWAVYLASAVALLGPLLLIVYLTRLQIVPEERVLHQTFGADFARYCDAVRRWI